MAVKILFNKPDVQSLANIYKEYALQNAELVAKKELALIGMAINNAAAKGAVSVVYKPSKDFTTLQGAYYNHAVEIMNEDFESAGYDYTVTEDRNGYVNGFSFDWSIPSEDNNQEPSTPAAEEEWEVIPDPSNGDDNGNDDPGEDNGNDGE